MRRVLVMDLKTGGKCYIKKVPNMSCSTICCSIIDKLEKELNVPIRHYHYGEKGIKQNEFKPLKNRRFKVDGYIKKTNTILEVFGDLWHGHPALGGGSICGKYFHTLFKNTEERLQLINTKFNNIYYIWISEINTDNALFYQFIKFDGKLKTRTLESSAYINNKLVRISRVGEKNPLRWGKKGDFEKYKLPELNKIYLPKLGTDNLYEWYV